MGRLIAILDKKGRNATEIAFRLLKTLTCKKTESIGMASPFTLKKEKDVHAFRSLDLDSHIVIGHVYSRILKVDKPQPIRIKNATLVFEGRIYPSSRGVSDAEVFAGRTERGPAETAVTFIKEAEGDFAFVLAEPEKLIAGRDPMGTQPLYYCENEERAVLASERKAMWKAGMENVHFFPPGHFAVVDKKGFRFKSINAINYCQAKYASMQAAAKELQSLLQQSIRQRVSELKQVAVAFSGGLDSSLIAFLAKKSEAKVHLIHVSLANQPETQHAKAVAKELRLPLHIQLFTEEDVEKAIPRVVERVEDSDPIKTSIGIPFYWIAEKTAEMKLKVLLAGQGADELFGGYKRYVDEYLAQGGEKTRRKMFDDVIRLSETNFERDFKICSLHDVELRLPFATYQIAKFAVNLPTELKIKLGPDTERKLVLRKAAENFGLPQFVVMKPKRAIQYATGINDAIKKIAKKNGLSIREYLTNVFQLAKNKMVQDEQNGSDLFTDVLSA